MEETERRASAILTKVSKRERSERISDSRGASDES
jgi:hypothetical protein